MFYYVTPHRISVEYDIEGFLALFGNAYIINSMMGGVGYMIKWTGNIWDIIPFVQ